MQEAAPATHLPGGVLFINIVDQLIRQGLELEPAPCTGQHRQAAEGGQELPHFGSWILDSPRKERTQDIRGCSSFTQFKCLTYHKGAPQAAWAWRQEQASGQKTHVFVLAAKCPRLSPSFLFCQAWVQQQRTLKDLPMYLQAPGPGLSPNLCLWHTGPYRGVNACVPQIHIGILSPKAGG